MGEGNLFRGRTGVFPHAAQTFSHILSLSVCIFEDANVSTTCNQPPSEKPGCLTAFLTALKWLPVIFRSSACLPVPQLFFSGQISFGGVFNNLCTCVT